MFELVVGKGGLVICWLNLSRNDPAGQHLLVNLIQYARGDDFKPKARVSPELLDPVLR